MPCLSSVFHQFAFKIAQILRCYSQVGGQDLSRNGVYDFRAVFQNGQVAVFGGTVDEAEFVFAGI